MIRLPMEWGVTDKNRRGPEEPRYLNSNRASNLSMFFLPAFTLVRHDIEGSWLFVPSAMKSGLCSLNLHRRNSLTSYAHILKYNSLEYF
jgi:hypothetical protein